MFNKIKYLMGNDNYKRFKKSSLLVLLDSLFHAIVYSMLFLSMMDIVKNDVTKNKIITYTLVMLAMSVIRFLVLNRGYTGLQVHGAESIADLRIKMGDYIRDLYMGYFNKNNLGSLTNIMTNDLQDFEMLITHMLPDLLKFGILSIYLSIVILIVNFKLGMIQTGLFLLLIPITINGGSLVKKAGGKAKAIRATMLSRVIEYASGIEVFKSYNMLGTNFKKLSKSMEELKKESINVELSGVPTIVITFGVIGISLPIMLYLAVNDLIAGEILKDNFIVFIMVGLAQAASMKAFYVSFIQNRYYTLSIDRLMEVLSEKQVSYTKSEFEPENYNIKFEDVDFKYVDNKEVLKNINFTAKEKEMTALIGASGSGKTTILNLIARFWDVDSGKIIIGNEKIVDIYPDSLMDKIGMVFQDVYLLKDTVYENIRMGNPQVGMEEVIKAAKIAHCHEFIMKMPQGYNTLVQEGGTTLSGGEKQRISIARALVKDAPIVLLDEATASLDADSEYEIKLAIEKLTENKTVIIIAHKLNTINRADQIVVFDNGEILEKGNHEDLMQLKGSYYMMYNSMMKSKEWEIID